MAPHKNREHVIDPRLGESRGVITRSKPFEQVISGKIVRSFRSLALPVSDRIGLASEATLHGRRLLRPLKRGLQSPRESFFIRVHSRF